MYICSFTCGRGFAYLLTTDQGEILTWDDRQAALVYLKSLNDLVRLTDKELSWVCLAMAKLMSVDIEELEIFYGRKMGLYEVVSKNGSVHGVQLNPRGHNYFRNNTRSFPVSKEI